MDALKAWLVETWGPSAIRGAVLGLFGILIAHTEILSKFGIVSDAAAQTTTIHWKVASNVIVPIVIAVLAGFIKTGHVMITKPQGGKPNA